MTVSAQGLRACLFLLPCIVATACAFPDADDVELEQSELRSVGNPMPAVAIGWEHSCALLHNGTINCWGSDSRGQLGNGNGAGDTGDKYTAVAVKDAGGAVINIWKAVTAGGYHTCALDTEGDIYCWGRDSEGQLGNGPGSTGDAYNPTLVLRDPGDYYVGITAGLYHTCAILDSGTARCWGYNAYGQIGDGTENVNRHSPVAVSVVSGLIELQAGGYHTCAVNQDGGAYCWGADFYGQVGDGVDGNADQLTPTQVQVTPVGPVYFTQGKALSLGLYHSCALRSDDTLWCWGSDSYGQLGNANPDTSSRDNPVQVKYDTSGAPFDGVHLYAGSYHTCAARADGTAWCWGRNDEGQLGTGNFGTETCTGVGCEQGAVQVRQASWPGSAALFNAVWVGGGLGHSCTMQRSGQLRCWGRDEHGQIGNGDATGPDPDEPLAVLVSGLSATAGGMGISAGHSHTCAAMSTGQAKCWGWDHEGEIGDQDEPESQPDPNQLTPTPVFFLFTMVSRIDSGGSFSEGGLGVGVEEAHSCATTGSGTVYCWGSDGKGQVGDGATGHLYGAHVPVQVSGLTNAIDVKTGGKHSCALLVDGTVRCWGYNQKGQLGNDDDAYANQNAPVQVDTDPGVPFTPLTRVVAIAAGQNASCAIRDDGTLWCWGDNSTDDIGRQTCDFADSSNVAKLVPVVDDVVAVAMGSGGRAFTQGGDHETQDHACVLTAAGAVKCWGANLHGQLGNDASGLYCWPTKVTPVGLGSDVLAIAAGNSHTCALKANGTVWCWGSAVQGQVGNGTQGESLPFNPWWDTPQQVKIDASTNLTGVVDLEVGSQHSCAIRVDGTAWCWGRNDEGQLGRTTINDQRLWAGQVVSFP